MRRIVDANVATLLERRAGAIGGRAELRGWRRRAAARLAAVLLGGSLVAGAAGGAARAQAEPGAGYPEGRTLVVRGHVGLTYRQAPSLDAGVLAVLPGGTVGTVRAGPVIADGLAWYRIGLPGDGPDGPTSGWVAAGYVLPVGSPPPGAG